MFKRVLNSSLLLIILIGLYPALFYSSNNWYIYSGRQIIALVLGTPLLTFLVGIILYLLLIGIVQLLHKFNLKRFQSQLSPKLRSALIVFYSCAVLFSLFQSSYRAIISDSYLINGFLFVLTILIYLGVLKAGLEFFNFPLLVVAIIASITWAVSYINAENTLNENAWFLKNKTRNDKIVFQEKPNVFLVVLESYQNNDTLKSFYEYDNTQFEDQLRKKDFTVYDHAFSNYGSTMTSLVSLFAMEHHYYAISKGVDDAFGARDLIGGRLYNAIVSVFKNNGYKIQYISDTDYTFITSPALDYSYPKRTIFSVFKVYRGQLLDDLMSLMFETYRGKGGRNVNEDRIYIDPKNIKLERKKRIEAAGKSPSPFFTYMKLSTTSHFSGRWDEPKNIKSHLRKIERENSEIENLIDQILKTDDDPLIILVGDHGAHRYRYAWEGEHTIHQNLKDHGIKEETVAKDRFATFLSVRFPSSLKPNEQIHSHVNLFRYVFSALCGCSSPLAQKADDISLLNVNNKLYKAIQNGKPLQRWEEISPAKDESVNK